MLDWDNGDISTGKLGKKLLCLYLVQHMMHKIKAQQFYTDLGLYQQCYVSQKIVKFKNYSRLLCDFPVLFKAGLLYKYFSRKPSKIKYFSSLCEPCLTVPHSAVGNVSVYRWVSDCRSRGRWFDPGPVPYFRGDWSWNNFYGRSPPFRWFIQEGLLSFTSESMCTNYWLTACSSLPRKKCG